MNVCNLKIHKSPRSKRHIKTHEEMTYQNPKVVIVSYGKQTLCWVLNNVPTQMC